MKKRILIISADSKNVAGAKSLQNELLKNHDVLLINFFEYITPNTAFTITLPNLNTVKKIIAHFDPEQVFLCAHGLPGYVNMCFYQKFTPSQDEELQNMCSAEELAQVLNYLLPNKNLTIDLLMCFGARSSAYRTNHITNINNINIFDSFAYRLIMILHKGHSHFTLNAFLTAIGYEYGSYIIEHEGAYELKNERDDLATERIAIQMKKGEPSINEEAYMQLAIEDDELLMKQIAIDEKRIKMRSRNDYGKMSYVIDNKHCLINFIHDKKSTNLYDGKIKTVIPYHNLLIAYIKNHYLISTIGLIALSVISAYLITRLSVYFPDENRQMTDSYKIK